MTAVGVLTGSYPNSYFVRANGATSNSNVIRTRGWHKFEIVVTSTNSYVKIDNLQVSNFSNPNLKTVNYIMLASTWGLTGVSIYDELSVTKN